VNQPNYYAIIPANVRYDNDLTPNSKLLYGEISALCNQEGYCWATNEYFSNLYQTTERTIMRNLNQLKEKGYIDIFYQTIDGNKTRIIATDRHVIEVTKMSLSDKNVTKVGDKNVTHNNTSKIIKEINNNKLLFTKKSFKKPTIEEIKDYCLERKNNIDAESFYDYYEANGWKVGRNPMKDWKATVRYWEKNNKKREEHNSTYQEKIISQQDKAREEFLRGG